MDVFQLSRPKLIIDMRIAPRFDLGQLTRRRFFDLIREYDCQYVDLFGRMGVDSVNDAVVNPALVAAQAGKFTAKLSIPNSGPLVFLHDEDLVDDDYVSALAKALPYAAGSSWQVYPSFQETKPSNLNWQSPDVEPQKFLLAPPRFSLMKTKKRKPFYSNQTFITNSKHDS